MFYFVSHQIIQTLQTAFIFYRKTNNLMKIIFQSGAIYQQQPHLIRRGYIINHSGEKFNLI
ncbi:hypothetical protein BAX97_03860 [Elizabethkingia meningoseptica]|uniref:Uncharacterized protein n=1 Tax=Elizabethkingia meningoseptica TaxID=238 RepID=A0A1T3K061_ELIME|nr:hypothetical protein BBD33_16355 [Elizabethkingia meningoseptica]AQX10986.1 hypothetical protein BBD35_00710 [Elizabethkingia meningoseptica]KUY14865.1 hypothetical protein ATB99_10170 [Elizabethkingia meningoseptica]ODM52139.1 hypothetical protein BES09_15270 [Elizabethkingia meningoseptica]OHT33240.1 hypothetical protein BGC12_16910 [Elizabethkingia meningoseptica]